MKWLVLVGLAVVMSSCSSNPHKAQNIDTEMERAQSVGAGGKIGLKDGDMVYQKKVEMNEELRDLQIEVYELEDKVYGNRKFGSKGIYGVLKRCRTDLSSPENGGDGKLKYMPPLDRVTDKEEKYEVGIDENDKLVAVTEEFLLDRIKRFKDYKFTLQKRQDEFQEKVDICEAELKARRYKMKQESGDN
jgi:hypothetical protein